MLVVVPSGSVEAAAPTGIPAPALVVGDTQLTVTWAAPANNGGFSINDYDVRYAVSNSNSWTVWSPGVNTTRRVVITGLINGQSYEVQVRAHNSGGSSSSWSTSARAMPAGVPAAPLAPTLTPDNTQLTARWAAPANNGALITGYTVRYKLTTTADWVNPVTRTTLSRIMTITGLTNLKSYDVQVRATNSVGSSNWSPSAQAVPGLTPSKPGAPTLLYTGPTTLAVEWDAPADNGAAIDNYEVRYRPVTDPVSDWVEWPTAVSTSKLVAIADLANKQTYEIQVQAHNLVGWSAWSDSLSAKTAGVPDAPAAPTLTMSNLELLVSWVAPADNGAAITDYDVQYRLTSTSPNGAWTDANYTGTGTSMTITGIINGVRYDVQVRAINNVLNTGGDWSPSATLTATPATPLAPTLAPGDERIRVSWVAPDDNGAAIDDYDVQYRLTGVSGWTDAIQGLITDGAGASMTITGLTNGTSYDVQVRAHNSVGDSDWSSSASATPTDQKPATPSGIRAGVTPPGDGFGYFDWNDPSDPSIIKYQYRKREGQSGAWSGWAEMPGSGATTKSYRFTGLTNFVNNYIDIRAVNLNGASPGSSNLGSASVFPRHPLPAPTGLTATAGDTEVELSWSMPSGAWDSSVTAYEYRQKEGSGDWGDWTQGSSSRSTTKHTVTNLTNGTTYSFQVRAMSLIPGLSSGVVSATPAPAAAPATPQAPTLIPGNMQLTVKWVAPAANGAAIDDYDVRYRLTSASDPDPWTDANHTGAGTSATITSLTNSTSYDVQVRAHNSVGWSGWSSSASAAPTDQKPAAPFIQGTGTYKGRGFGDGFITIVWANPSDPSITGYQYQQREQGDDWPTPTVWTNMVPSDATTQGFTFEGLTPFVIYDFRIRAVNHNGESEPSNVRYEVKALGTMPAPTNLMATPGGGEVQLRWTMPSGAWDSEIAFYEYRKKEGSSIIWGAWTKSSVAGSLSTTHVVSGLTNGVTYSFEVRAGTYSTSGEASNVASAVPVGVPSRPGAPTLVVGNQQLDVSWNEPADNGTSISDYDVQYKETSDGDWTEWNPGTSTTRSATITGLINDTGYQVRVRATSSAGSSLWSDTADATPEAQIPAAPAAPTLTPGNMQLTVTWVAPADNGAAISDYDVQYRLTSASPSDPWTDANHTGTGTSTTITGLTNGTSYDVQVLAFNSAGFGPWSLSASATPVPAAAPATPQAPTLAPYDGEIRVTWAAPADNGAAIDDYDVQYRLTSASASDPWTDANYTGTGTSTTITSLINGTSYDVQVRAHNSVDWSGWSLSASATPGVRPAAPSSLATQGSGDGFVDLTWNAPGDASITGYQYQYKTTSGAWGASWTNIQGSDSTTTGFIVRGLTNFVEYDLRIRAVNAVGAGPASQGYGQPVGQLPAPTGLTATAGHQAVELRWSMPSGTWDPYVTSYQYQKKEGSGDWGDWTESSSKLNKLSTTHIVTGLTNGTAYDFRVRAMLFASPGLASGEASATPVAVPSRPEVPTLVANDQQLAVSWVEPADNGTSISDYDVQYKETSVILWTDASYTGTGTSTTITGLTNGTSYDVQVRAASSVGNSLWSDAASATPGVRPAQPSGFGIHGGGDGFVILGWENPGDSSITGYQYQKESTGEWGAWTNIPGSSTMTEFTVMGLTNFVEYRLRVRAVNGIGAGPATAVFLGRPAGALPAPTNLTATPGNQEVELSWTMSSGAWDDYIVYYDYQMKEATASDWGDDWTESSNIGGTGLSTTHVVTGLTNGVTYDFRVRARGFTGPGLESNKASATPVAPVATTPDAPGVPTLVVGNRQLGVSWDAPADNGAAITDYDVQYRPVTDPVSSWTEWNAGDTSVTIGVTITNLDNGTSYDVQVRATNSVGDSDWSPSARASPSASAAQAPSTPLVPTVTPGDGQLEVSWMEPDANGDAITGYEVEYKLNSETGWSNHRPRRSRRFTVTGTSATIYGLINGRRYDVRVRATNGIGSSAWSASSASAIPAAASPGAGPSTRPGAPAPPTLVPGNGQLAVSWNAPADDGGSPIRFYHVYVHTADGLWKRYFLGSPITSTLITGLTNGQSYWVVVRAGNVKGDWGPPARSDSATPLATLAAVWITPSVPTELSAVAEDGAVALSWTASAQGSGSIGYDLQYRSGDGSWTFVPSGRISGTSHTISGLTNGMEYEFQVRASNLYPSGIWFMSAWTASVTAMPEAASPGGVPAAPAAPLAPTLIPGNAQLSVEWARPDANFDTITGYDVRYKRSSDSAWSDHSHTGAGRNTVIDGLTNGQSYEVQVLAKNSVGSSGWSASARAAPGAPGAPDGFVIDESGDGFVILTWDDPSDASITGYQYQKRSTGDWGASWTRIPGSSATTTELTVTGLANFVIYYFRIRAVNAVGPGPVSRTIPRDAVGILPAPTGLTATPGNQGVELNWSMPSGAWVDYIASYEYQMKEATASVWGAWTESSNIVGGVGGLSTMHIVTGLTNGVTYDFKVRARSLSVSAPPGLESIPASATLPAVTVPGAPDAPTLTPGDRRLEVSWSVPADDGGWAVTGYNVRWRPAAGGAWKLDGTAATRMALDLLNGRRYEVQVRAMNGRGPGPWSEPAFTEPAAAGWVAPSAPTDLSAIAQDGAATLSWSASTQGSGRIGYDLQYRTRGSGSWTFVPSGLISGTSHTISGLANDIEYEFQARASNLDPSGVWHVSAWTASVTATPEAASPAATPAVPVSPGFAPAVPLAPTLTPGDSELAVAWDAPAANGAEISDYDVRYKRSSDTAWSDHHTGAGTETTISGLTNGQLYEVQVRANNRVGGSDWSPSARATPAAAPAVPLAPTLTPGDSELAVAWDAPAANGAEISDYDVRYKRSSDTAWSDHPHTGADTETTISGLTNGQLYEVQVRANNRVGGSDWSPSARATPAAAPAVPLAPTLTPGDGELAVAWDAPAANGAAISDYDVRYKRSSDSAWSDHAHTGADTETTIPGLTNGQGYEVQVRAKNRVGWSGWSPSARATPLAGWIAALVPMELAYFGRTVTSQVVDVVEARLAAPRSPGRQVTLAGHALPSWDGEAANSSSGGASRDAEEALRNWLVQAGANESGQYDNGYGGERGVESRALSEREMVAGTSFALTRDAAGGADFASVWGRGSTKHFEGQADGLTLDGEVTTGFIGADWASARWRAGLAVGYSNGTGEYRGADGSGQVETTLTGVYPYTGIKLSDRLSVWATAGHGAGDLTLKPGDGEEIETDLSMSLVAAGMRSEIHRPEGDSGLAFAVKADTRFARTSAEAAQGDSGHLAAAVAEVWQARAGLEGSRRFAFGEVGTVLTPSFEVGLRFDGGDAGRGFGVDLGGGLAFANPQRGLKLDLNARSLVAHEARDLREWGASVGLSFDPRPSTERGLEWSFGQSWGASASGGMEALFGRETLAGLEANDPAAGSRLEGEIGYGLPVFGGGFTGTPYTGFGLSSDGARDYAVGWRLTLARPGDSGFEVGLEATRREAANDGDAPEHGAMLRAKIRW